MRESSESIWSRIALIKARDNVAIPSGMNGLLDFIWEFHFFVLFTVTLELTTKPSTIRTVESLTSLELAFEISIVPSATT